MTRSKKETESLLAAIRAAAAGAVGCKDITEHLDSNEASALGMLKERLDEHEGKTLRKLKAEERSMERDLETAGYRDVDGAEDLDSVRMAIEVKAVCRLTTAIETIGAALALKG
jgi:dTDP-4-dehydrorhamnose reductase